MEDLSWSYQNLEVEYSFLEKLMAEQKEDLKKAKNWSKRLHNQNASNRAKKVHWWLKWYRDFGHVDNVYSKWTVIFANFLLKEFDGSVNSKGLHNRELKQTTRTRATKTSQKKDLRSSTNNYAHALFIFLHFFAVFCKRTTKNLTKACLVWGTRTTVANFSYFHLQLNAVI